MSDNSRVTRQVGDIVSLKLHDGSFAFGRVLPEPVMAFYDINTPEIPALDEILEASITFKIWVMNHAITDGLWQVIGSASLGEEFLEESLFFKKDPISKELSIYRDGTGQETPATVAECEGLECAAVWEPEHVVDRLSDHFAGRPNKWVELLLPTR